MAPARGAIVHVGSSFCKWERGCGVVGVHLRACSVGMVVICYEGKIFLVAGVDSLGEKNNVGWLMLIVVREKSC